MRILGDQGGPSLAAQTWMGTPILELLRRAKALHREILVLASVILIADVLAAYECLDLVHNPSVRTGIGLGSAFAVVVACCLLGRHLERELLAVRGETARTL